MKQKTELKLKAAYNNIYIIKYTKNIQILNLAPEYCLGKLNELDLHAYVDIEFALMDHEYYFFRIHWPGKH
jgi:hypothetical protein